MNLESINKRLTQLDDYERYPSEWGPFRAKEREERARLLTERDRLVRRAPLERALMPTQNIFRSFIRTLAEHLIGVALQHRITVAQNYRALGGGRKFGGLAHIDRRQAVVPPCLTEVDYAIGLHEYVHIISPQGDSRQHRHWIDGDFLVSPLGEACTWLGAIQLCYRDPREPDRPLWTSAMHDKLASSLESYKAKATPHERERLCAAIGLSFSAQVPAPDSAAGREYRVARIAAERTPSLGYLKRLSKVHAIAGESRRS